MYIQSGFNVFIDYKWHGSWDFFFFPFVQAFVFLFLGINQYFAILCAITEL